MSQYDSTGGLIFDYWPELEHDDPELYALVKAVQPLEEPLRGRPRWSGTWSGPKEFLDTMFDIYSKCRDAGQPFTQPRVIDYLGMKLTVRELRRWAGNAKLDWDRLTRFLEERYELEHLLG